MLNIGDKFIFRKNLIPNKKYGNLDYLENMLIGDLTIKEKCKDSEHFRLGNGYYVTKEMHILEQFKQQTISLDSLLKHEN